MPGCGHFFLRNGALEDRGYVNISARATEGASYEYMSAYMDQIAPVGNRYRKVTI